MWCTGGRWVVRRYAAARSGFAADDVEVVTTAIREILTHQVDEYLIVTTERARLEVTVEHPFYVGDGTFKTLAALRPGDTVFAFDGVGLSVQRILSFERVAAPGATRADRPRGGGDHPAGRPGRTGERRMEMSGGRDLRDPEELRRLRDQHQDRKSTRLNSSHRT